MAKRKNRTYSDEYKKEAIVLLTEQEATAFQKPLHHLVLRLNYYITGKTGLNENKDLIEHE